MPFRRKKFEPHEYKKGDKLKAKTVNELIKTAEEQSAFSTTDGLSGELGQLIRTVAKLLIRRIQFTEALTEGGTALAKLLEWKGGDTYDVDDGTEFNVSDGTGSTATNGEKAYAVYMPDRGTWERLTGGGADRRCTGLLTASLSSSAETFTVDNVAAVVGASPVTDPSDTVTVYNTHNWAADDDALCRFEWHAENERWEAYQVTCPAEASV